MGGPVEAVTINAEDDSIRCATNTCGVLRNYIQHRLDVRRRAGDDAENLTCGSLLFQRLLELSEQPHVLNGNHGLIGKGFEQFDLRGRERADFNATRTHYPNKFPVLT